MSVETDSDRAAFLADFGQAARYASATKTVTLTGLFDAPSAMIVLGRVDMVDRQPSFLARSRDLPADAATGAGDTLTLMETGEAFDVIALQPDSLGMTLVTLGK